MAATQHHGAGAKEVADDAQAGGVGQGADQRQAQQQGTQQAQHGKTGGCADARALVFNLWTGERLAHAHANQAAQHHGQDLAPERGHREHQHGGRDSDTGAQTVWAQGLGHAPHRLRHHPTAAIFSPWMRPDCASTGHCDMPMPNAMSATAEGIVKPSHAAKAPRQPQRLKPKAMPTWLLAGPGRNWHKATRSE